jgi:alpha-L-fucosidase
LWCRWVPATRTPGRAKAAKAAKNAKNAKKIRISWRSWRPWRLGAVENCCHTKNSGYGGEPFYLDQLTELLTEYGELGEVWFDGACGEGPTGKRQRYDRPAVFELCDRLQPNAVTFGDGGTGVRWVGNERGFAGEPNWSLVDSKPVRYPGDAGIDRPTDARAFDLAMARELHHGDPAGDRWRPAEVNTSIRPGWFYHPAEDDCVRSVANLVDVYFRSVGRNGVMLLNVPPDRRGLMHEVDVARLAGLGRRVGEIFADDVTAGASVERTADGVTLSLPGPRALNVLRLAEPIELGQRVGRFRVHYRDADGQWAWLVDGDTIGHRKLERFDAVVATGLRVQVTEARAAAVLSEVSAFLT